MNRVRETRARCAWLLALVVSCGALAVTCATLGQRDDELRIVVYNIHAGKDASGEPNLDRVAELVRELEADVVLLQEVDRGTERSGRVDQLAELERSTGLRGAFGKTLDYQGGDYGIAVLSRWPISADSLVRLPVEPAQQRAGGSYEPRGALHVTLEGPGGRLHVIDTHLDPGAEDFHRIQEARAVGRLARSARADSPRVLVGGDLNAEPGSRAVGELSREFLRDAWSGCGEGQGLTYPADDPVKRIDYLLIADAFDCVRAEVLAEDHSDHRPVLFVLRAR